MQVQPRIAPLDDAELSEEQRELVSRGGTRPVLNIFRTLVRHPEFYRAFGRFGQHILAGNTLDARSRELLILRTGVLCECAYEVHQHKALARRVGMREDELSRIEVGPSAPEWTAHERALLQAADELFASKRISDATWKQLAETLNEQQLIDLVFTVGQYTMVSMALNTFGVQIEEA